MLGCDGCGAIVSDRAGELDAAAAWWVLTPGPTIGGGLLPVLAGLSMSLDVDEDHPLAGEPVELDELPPIDPPRHFCSLTCLSEWARRAELDSSPPAP